MQSPTARHEYARVEAGAGFPSLDENRFRGNAMAAETPPVVPLASPAPGVGLWWCVLEATASQLQACASVLSTAEHRRAARFGDERLRNRYVIGRAALRTILAGTLGLAPRDVQIVRGARGRPQLAGNTRLDFNVSHTGDVALLGLLNDARLGVDVEHTARSINVAGIARKFLSANERAALAALDADAARRTVLTLWTCKEAMSKATGDALSAPFALLDVELTSEPRLRDGPGAYRPARWSLHAAVVPDAYVATIAVWRPA
jgi:4'-phosphopantetheinyl transferase